MNLLSSEVARHSWSLVEAEERGGTHGIREGRRGRDCDSNAHRKSFVTVMGARNLSQGGTKNNKHDSLSAMIHAGSQALRAAWRQNW